MKKLLIIFPYEMGDKPFSGGVSKVVMSNIEAGLALSLKTVVVFPKKNEGLELYIRENYKNVKCVPMNICFPKLYSDSRGLSRVRLIINDLFRTIFEIKNLYKFFKKEKPDIIHYHEVLTFPAFLLSAKGTKQILHIHTYRFLEKKFVGQLVVGFINKYIETIVVPTDSIENKLRSISKVKPGIKIIKTPYYQIRNRERALGVDKIVYKKTLAEFTLGFVGRICRIKRIDHILMAMSLFGKNDLSKIKLIIVGAANTDGDKIYMEELRSMIADLGLKDCVEFLGYIDSVEQILPFIDVGLILSESEAIPMIGVEYMQYDIPIIAYDVPGLSDMISSGYNGIICKNGEIRSVKRAILEMMELTKLKEYKDNVGEEKIKYTLESFTKDLSPLYDLS
jgi:glycosyltransferase involved in cell wall biosynthesis